MDAATDFLVVCPKCDHRFPVDLNCVSQVGGCASDPAYDTVMTCPKCGYEKEIL